MTPLRRRMLEDMQLRNLSKNTQTLYLHAVERLARFYNRSPDKLTRDQVREFLVHLVTKEHAAPSTFNVYRCGLSLFYRVTLRRGWVLDDIVCAKAPKHLPVVLSQDEVRKFLGAIRNRKYHALFITAYAAGLRVSELVNLKVTDIDSQRMVIRVRQGKGQKDRFVMLSPQLLTVLRDYWRLVKPKTWLFPSTKKGDGPVSRHAVFRACRQIARLVGLSKPVSPHTLRHSFATHSRHASDAACTPLVSVTAPRDRWRRSKSRIVHYSGTDTSCRIYGCTAVVQPRIGRRGGLRRNCGDCGSRGAHS